MLWLNCETHILTVACSGYEKMREFKRRTGLILKDGENQSGIVFSLPDTYIETDLLPVDKDIDDDDFGHDAESQPCNGRH